MCDHHGPTTNAKGKSRLKNPHRYDPQRSITLRKKIIGDVKRRLRALKAAIYDLVVTQDAFGIAADQAAAKAHAATLSGGNGRGLDAILTNESWRFETDADKVKAYQKWLKSQVDNGFLEVSPGNENSPWLEKYLTSSYKKGVTRAYTDAKAAKLAAAGAGDDFVTGGKKAFLDSAFSSPVAQTKLQLIYTRSFSQLKGVTTQMDQDMSRVLAQGLADGRSPKVLAKDLTDVVDGIERRRALTIARTELSYAHSEGQLDSFEALGVDELGVMAEWSTAGDNRVCPLCAPMEGVILTVKEARGMIPRHPNCVAGDMRVLAPGALSLLKTKYTGEIIEIFTATGRRLAVTPAHVLLTQYGFARADSIHKGLYLVYDAGMYAGAEAPNYKADIPRIADEFVAAAEAFSGNTRTIPTAAKDLHNEGSSCDKEIDVVFSDRVLRGGDKAVSGEGIFDGTLPFCQGGVDRSRLSSLHELLRATAHTADSSMGRRRDLLAFFMGCVLKAQEIDSGTTTAFDPGIGEPFIDDLAADAKALRQCVDRHPILKQLTDGARIDFAAVLSRGAPDGATRLQEAGLGRVVLNAKRFGDFVDGHSSREVQMDQVVRVRKRYVESFDVYDVQTISTQYAVEGIVSSNCRCSFIPGGVGEHEGGTTTTVWTGADQPRLAPPGTAPTGAMTGQIWSKNVTADRIRQSVQAESPNLPIAEARKKSQWKGRTKKASDIAQKLKPGSKAWKEALTAEKIAKAAAASATQVAAAQKAAAVRKAELAESMRLQPGAIEAIDGGGWEAGAKFEVDDSFSLGGSTGAKVVDATNGGSSSSAKWVMKDYSGNSLQAENEFLANSIYNAVSPRSAPAARIGKIRNRNGGESVAVFNRFIDGGEELGKLSPVVRKLANEEASKNFVLDSWLANWDSVGMTGDNMMLVGDKVVRIDNGGALLFRAQGGRKGSAFGPQVTELTTLRDSGLNPSAAKTFGKLTDKDVADQITDLEKAIEKEGGVEKFLQANGINQISDTALRKEIGQTLQQRYGDLLKQRDKLRGADFVPLAERRNRLEEFTPKKTNTDVYSTKGEANRAMREVVDSIPSTQRNAVRRFTSNDYAEINEKHLEKVREGRKGTRTVANINKGLAQMPGYSGVVGRGHKYIDPVEFDKYKSGEWPQVWWTCPASSSANPGNVYGSSRKRGVCFIIRTKGKRNAYVQDISHYDNEHEALFMGDSRFRVVGVAETDDIIDGSHQRFIVMDELDVGEAAPEKQAAPTTLDAKKLWMAFQNDAKRAGMPTSGDVKGQSVDDLLKEAQEDE
jgi:SPP1 gp7 family putative phage head morphogenesis protein